jgi:hypothetical protein
MRDDTAKTQDGEDPVWPEVAIWARLDALAGLVLQTGSAVLVAAIAFGLQAHHFDRTVLFTAVIPVIWAKSDNVRSPA